MAEHGLHFGWQKQWRCGYILGNKPKRRFGPLWASPMLCQQRRRKSISRSHRIGRRLCPRPGYAIRFSTYPTRGRETYQEIGPTLWRRRPASAAMPDNRPPSCRRAIRGAGLAYSQRLNTTTEAGTRHEHNAVIQAKFERREQTLALRASAPCQPGLLYRDDRRHCSRWLVGELRVTQRRHASPSGKKPTAPRRRRSRHPTPPSCLNVLLPSRSRLHSRTPPARLCPVFIPFLHVARLGISSLSAVTRDSSARGRLHGPANVWPSRFQSHRHHRLIHSRLFGYRSLGLQYRPTISPAAAADRATLSTQRPYRSFYFLPRRHHPEVTVQNLNSCFLASAVCACASSTALFRPQ